MGTITDTMKASCTIEELRIFELYRLCIDNLHVAPGISSPMLTAVTGLMYHGSTCVHNIATSIWTSFLFILFPLRKAEIEQDANLQLIEILATTGCRIRTLIL